MSRYGYFLSAEEYSPPELVSQARMAEQAGFEALWISDHFHPWLDEQGQSGFVWSLIGAISQVTSLPITTAVTCPLLRQHPAIVSQAAATSALLTGGRFTLGVGTGEVLNEHILGSRWPSAEERLEMLEEAVQLIRELLTGQLITHEGKHYTVDTARLYSVPDRPPPVFMSGFGEKAIKLAARIADGYMGTMPDAEFVRLYRESGGGDRPVQGGLKTSDAVKLSSCVRKFPGAGGEGGGFVVVLAGGQAVVQAAEQAAEQVALGGGVPVAGVASPVVVGAGAG